MKYELKGHQDVSVIRHEKCIVKDHHFYFQKDAIGNQSEINREVAKYFSEGNEKCIRDLRLVIRLKHTDKDISSAFM